jgi:2-phosphosulfolactate phosphatase
MGEMSHFQYADVYHQTTFRVRFGWGMAAVERLAPISDVVIIVDVLSFTTSVEIATARGAVVFPYRGRGDDAAEFARSVGAKLASINRTGGDFSLSPASLRTIPAGTRLVLPSPNGSTLSLGTGSTPTLAACLRNCRAVAAAAARLGQTITVIAAGERWREDQTLRPAFEDQFGAGAVISFLPGDRSPEAFAAATVFQAGHEKTYELIKDCGSGKELVARGSGDDLALAAQVDVSDCVPVLKNSAYANASAG